MHNAYRSEPSDNWPVQCSMEWICSTAPRSVSTHDMSQSQRIPPRFDSKQLWADLLMVCRLSSGLTYDLQITVSRLQACSLSPQSARSVIYSRALLRDRCSCTGGAEIGCGSQLPPTRSVWIYSRNSNIPLPMLRSTDLSQKVEKYLQKRLCLKTFILTFDESLTND